MLIKSKNQRHSIEEKLQTVELYRQGYGCWLISKKLSINLTVIRSWLRLYRFKGLEGLVNPSKPKLNAAFRQIAVQDYLDNKLSFKQASLKYGVSDHAIADWVKKAKNHGISSLSDIKHNGRPSKTMGRPKKKEPETELEKLKAELEYVLAENAYLKKLNALVEQRIVRESSKKSKPSSY
jgi:transposase-like protein